MTPGDPTRASDEERTAVVDRLQQAHVEGRLTSEELAERIESALQARTRGDLAPLLDDLPGALQQAAVAVPQPKQPAKSTKKESLAPAWTAWAVSSSVTFVVWGIIFVTTGGAAAYPWFLWVAGPWGAVLLAKTISSRLSNDD